MRTSYPSLSPAQLISCARSHSRRTGTIVSVNLKLSRTSSFRPRQTPPSVRFAVCLLALLAIASGLSAQTLARPGWAGSGLTVNRWWKHAVILDLPSPAAIPTPDRLDNLRTLGIDAILLRGVPSLPPETANTIDDLLREASQRNLRVLVHLPADQSPVNLAAAARGWATRGAAGFLLTATTPVALRSVRAALLAIPGERILITTPGPNATTQPQTSPQPTARTTPTSPIRRSPQTASAELSLFPIAGLTRQPDPAQLRSSLSALLTVSTTTLVAVETPRETLAETPPELDRIAAATALLSTPGASLLEAIWLDPPPSSTSISGSNPAAPNHTPADQLRQFTALHHDRPAFRDGPTTLLDHAPEGAVVWLRRGPTGVTFVVACNLRPTPLRLSLTDDLARLHLRGTFLKTLSRSDPGLGAMPLNALTLPPFGVYIGELSR